MYPFPLPPRNAEIAPYWYKYTEGGCLVHWGSRQPTYGTQQWYEDRPRGWRNSPRRPCPGLRGREDRRGSSAQEHEHHQAHGVRYHFELQRQDRKGQVVTNKRG